MAGGVHGAVLGGYEGFWGNCGGSEGVLGGLRGPGGWEGVPGGGFVGGLRGAWRVWGGSEGVLGLCGAVLGGYEGSVGCLGGFEGVWGGSGGGLEGGPWGSLGVFWGGSEGVLGVFGGCEGFWGSALFCGAVWRPPAALMGRVSPLPPPGPPPPPISAHCPQRALREVAVSSMTGSAEWGIGGNEGGGVRQLLIGCRLTAHVTLPRG